MTDYKYFTKTKFLKKLIEWSKTPQIIITLLLPFCLEMTI